MEKMRYQYVQTNLCSLGKKHGKTIMGNHNWKTNKKKAIVEKEHGKMMELDGKGKTMETH